MAKNCLEMFKTAVAGNSYSENVAKIRQIIHCADQFPKRLQGDDLDFTKNGLFTNLFQPVFIALLEPGVHE